MRGFKAGDDDDHDCDTHRHQRGSEFQECPMQCDEAKILTLSRERTESSALAGVSSGATCAERTVEMERRLRIPHL